MKTENEVLRCPKCWAMNVVTSDDTDNLVCSCCGWSNAEAREITKDVAVAEEDKEELVRLALGLESVLSKYIYTDYCTEDRYQLSTVAKLKTLTREVLKTASSLPVIPNFTKITIFKKEGYNNG